MTQWSRRYSINGYRFNRVSKPGIKQEPGAGFHLAGLSNPLSHYRWGRETNPAIIFCFEDFANKVIPF